MTKKEAIGCIKDVICENNTIKPNMVVFEQEKEALYMAIKALEQESCEDAISRKDIIAKIEDEYEGYMLDETCCPQDFVYMIMDMPSVNCGTTATQLEQDDCISRAEVILQIQRHGVGCFDPDEFSPEQAERFVINMLNELPSVKPEPKTGHWIPIPYQIENGNDAQCSECGGRFIDAIGYKVCPMCEAKMEW